MDFTSLVLTGTEKAQIHKLRLQRGVLLKGNFQTQGAWGAPAISPCSSPQKAETEVSLKRGPKQKPLQDSFLSLISTPWSDRFSKRYCQ